MQLVIIKSNKLRSFFLPAKVFGNYWVLDDDRSNLVNVEASEDKWVLRSNDDIKIVNRNTYLDSVFLLNYSYCFLKSIKTNENFIIYCIPTYDETSIKLAVNGNDEISFGSDASATIMYDNQNIAGLSFKINHSNNEWTFTGVATKLVYINKVPAKDCKLKVGDTIFVMGFKMIIGRDFIVINNPNNKVKYNSGILAEFSSTDEIPTDTKELDDDTIVDLYKDDDYFLRAPRFKSKVEPEVISIDPPPASEKGEEMPFIYTVGPMITMGMTSMVTVVTTITNLRTSNQPLKNAIPSLLIAFAMLMSIILWPSLTRRYTKRQKAKKEEKRKTKYLAYLEEKKKNISEEIVKQRQIAIENNISLDECINIINAKKRNLWEREIEDEDFLTVRIGVGAAAPDLEIKAPEEHFSLEDDELNITVQSIVNSSKMMEDVPINVSLAEKNIMALVGQEKANKAFIDGLILQLITFHSFDELKIVLFTNEENADKWNYLKILPHCWDDLKTLRFFATNAEDMKQISIYLEKIFNDRKYSDEKERDLDYKSFKPYYIIITDNLKVARNIEIVKKVLDQKLNLGFSLLIKNERLANLPGECSTFLNIDPSGSGMFENELVSTKQKSFAADLKYDINLDDVARKLANIPLEIHSAEGSLPEVVSFLQMYNIGKVEQLNTINRWKTNNPTVSLQVPVGIDENGELFNLDLHEKFHGPHGLIAGMTGSGKSEFIITYILSLAVNFHPDEIQFVLIDYKGGGLAGAFENKETGMKLPHLAGTITNLDTIEMNRSLASIQSELRRRQKLFNEARDSLNESTIDIYKYQKLYRDGLVKKPVSHLFIISDEFAELKAQQPEFMSQLISTARIGRSLGVHLILSTQKPAGVVDDQIWSNSKFRVCLKVQDKSDSMDMIKCPDAAMLKRTGRFYLQVGYNEFFALGQSAWCGAQYYPSDKVRKKVDNSIGFINSLGQTIKSVEDNKKTVLIASKGEELPNIMKYLVNIAKDENIQTSRLWLERIPDFIFVENLKKKYNYQEQPFTLKPVIGEFDDPNNQRQDLLTLPLTEDGNLIIYGAAGSGKEQMLTTIIYSLIVGHSVEEVNIYALDFGAETLKVFNGAPQLGDILYVGDQEKIVNLIKMLQEMIETRKKLFTEYNGSYVSFIKNSGKKLPSIIVIINNYEMFNESYYDYEDSIQQLSRDGLKYGIIFILTTSGTNTIKYRLRQNFKQELVLQMNDSSDYTAILGNTNKVFPSKVKGRGLVKYDATYEFQTAYPYKEDEQADYIKQIVGKLKEAYKTRAKPVPILPDSVTLDFVKDYLLELSSVPIGVSKGSLSIECFDFKTKYFTLVASSEMEMFGPFINGLTVELSNISNDKLYVFDTTETLVETVVAKTKAINGSFDDSINKICDYITDANKIYVDSNYNRESLKDKPSVTLLSIGFVDMLDRLGEEVKNRFIECIEKGKDLGVVNIIAVDSVINVKKLEYEGWYKTVVATNRGIWLGNGIADQFSIKLTRTPRELRDVIEPGFGYSIKNGIANLVKFIEYKEEDSGVDSIE